MKDFLLGRGNGIMHKQCICFSFAISAGNVAIKGFVQDERSVHVHFC